jgi:hypothetical protein
MVIMETVEEKDLRLRLAAVLERFEDRQRVINIKLAKLKIKGQEIPDYKLSRDPG